MLKYLLPLLIACGTGPALKGGIYDVIILYTHDDWPGSYVGIEHAATWEIRHDEEEHYTVQVLPIARTFKGENQGGLIVVSKHRENCNDADIVLNLTPDENEEEFVGHGRIMFVACEGWQMLTEANFRGYLQNEQ